MKKTISITEKWASTQYRKEEDKEWFESFGGQNLVKGEVWYEIDPKYFPHSKHCKLNFGKVWIRLFENQNPRRWNETY